MTKKNCPSTTTVEKFAQYFIWKSQQEGRPITNKKLQKLLYYAQAWNLVFNNEVLFEEPIEAWVHGPAIRSIYQKYKRYSFGPIVEKIPIEPKIPNKDLLDEVWDVYGGYNGDYLELLSHRERPWQKARDGLEADENSSNEITHESMKEFYKLLLKDGSK